MKIEVNARTTPNRPNHSESAADNIIRNIDAVTGIFDKTSEVQDQMSANPVFNHRNNHSLSALHT
jgi:hypothetical protein